jgi:hypothetical protein
MKMRRLPHWNITRFGTPRNLIDEGGGVAEYIYKIDAVAHERACLHHLAEGTYRRRVALEERARNCYWSRRKSGLAGIMIGSLAASSMGISAVV